MNTEQLKTAEEIATIIWASKHCGSSHVQLIENLASQESKRAVEKDRESRWINRTDRLPEPKDANRLGEVLSLDDKGIVTTIHFNNVRGFDQYTFWQPLPEPPKPLTP